MKQKRIIRTPAFWLTGLLPIVFAFQNCGKGFNTATVSSLKSEVGPEAPASVVVDKSPPIVEIAAPAAGASHTTGLTLSGACESDIPVVIDGTGASATVNTTCNNSSFSAAVLFSGGFGTKVIKVTQVDSSGNIGTVERSFTKLAPPDAFPKKGLSVPFDQLRWLSDSELSAILDDHVALGSKSFRVDIFWANIQPTNSTTYNWTETDRVLNAIVARKLRVLGILLSTPTWARVSGTNVPANPNAFAEFARQVALRYSKIGIHDWEIWNEPNLPGFFSTMNVVTYTSLLKAAYPAIKSADPSATVLTAGLSPVPSTGPTYVSAIEFMNGIYANGGKGFFDAVAFHPYSWPMFPSNTASWNGWRIMSGNPTSIRSIMVSNGDSAKKIWITEYGAPSNNVGETNQANMLTESYQLWSTYSWAGPLFWYAHKDRGTDTSDTENFYGLLRFNGTHKPSYDRFKQLP